MNEKTSAKHNFSNILQKENKIKNNLACRDHVNDEDFNSIHHLYDNTALRKDRKIKS